MGDVPYDELAGVYEWLVPDALLTPEGAAAAFAPVVGALEPGARVLDCAAGTGQLAVGLALRGFAVTASDRSSAMIDRTRSLASLREVDVQAVTCEWSQLPAHGFRGVFDAVLCVGNSLVHATGRTGRRAALADMAAVLRDGGLLAVTSRNWERVRAEGSGLRVADRLTGRSGRRGLVVHSWTIAPEWDDRHQLDVAVAVIDEVSGAVTTTAERLDLWPFTHGALDEDLRAAGLTPQSSTYADEVERYLICARRSAADS